MAESHKTQTEPNALYQWCDATWRAFNSNSATATVIWAVILAGLVGAVGFIWFSRASADTNASLWYSVETATDVEDLKRLATEFPAKMPGRVAEFQVARRKLQDGLGALAAPNAEERLRAADSVEDARKLYAKLAADPATPLLLRQEALMQQAKAEETLASVPKADNSGPRGDLDTAQKLYESLAAQFAGSFQAAAAAARTKELKDDRKTIEQLTAELRAVQAPPAAGPALPVAAPPLPVVPPPPPPSDAQPK